VRRDLALLGREDREDLLRHTEHARRPLGGHVLGVAAVLTERARIEAVRAERLERLLAALEATLERVLVAVLAVMTALGLAAVALVVGPPLLAGLLAALHHRVLDLGALLLGELQVVGELLHVPEAAHRLHGVLAAL